MTILDDRARERLAPHTMQDQLIAAVDCLLAERRHRFEVVKIDRRGVDRGRPLLGKGFDRYLDEKKD